MRCRGRFDKVSTVEKCKVGRGGPIERRNIDDTTSVRRRRSQRGAGQRSDVFKREARRLSYEDRLAHTHCSPIPGTACGGRDQNLVPPLKRKNCVRSQTSGPPAVGVAQYFVIG